MLFHFILSIQISFCCYLCYFFAPLTVFPLCYFALVLSYCKADSFQFLFLPIILLKFAFERAEIVEIVFVQMFGFTEIVQFIYV